MQALADQQDRIPELLLSGDTNTVRAVERVPLAPSEAALLAGRLGALAARTAADGHFSVARRAGRNVAWRVETAHRSGLFVKTAHEAPAGGHPEEARRLRVLREADALGDLAPEPLPSAVLGGLAMALLPGEPLGTTSLTTDQARSLGRGLARIHGGSIPGIDTGRPLGLTLHRPSVHDVNAAPPGLRTVIEIVQSEPHLVECLDAAARGWEPETLIHNDITRENVLLDGPTARFVDWESSGRGDPAWDLGSALALTAGQAIDRLFSAEGARPAGGADAVGRAILWAYLSTRRLGDEEAFRLLRRTEVMVAVRLVQDAAELAAMHDRAPRRAIASLQIAHHLMTDPQLVRTLLRLPDPS